MKLDSITTLEVAEGVVTDGGTGDMGAAAPDDGAAGAVEAPSAAPAWSADDPAFREAVAATAGEIADAKLQQFLASLQTDDTAAGQTYETPTLDPFSDDFGSQLAQLIAQSNQQVIGQMQQLLQPMLGQHEEKQNAEGQQRIADIVSDIAAREGDFTGPGKAAVPDIAPLFLEQFERTFGQGPKAAEAALNQAAKVIRGIETAAATAAVEKYKNELSTIGGARGIPAGGSSGIEAGPRPTSLLEAGRRFAERHAAGTV